MFSPVRLPALAMFFGLALVVAATPIAVVAATMHISTDPFTQATCAASSTTNHLTEVEPDTFSNGSTIVAAFQVGRVFDGGACAVGFATSTTQGTGPTTAQPTRPSPSTPGTACG